MKKSVLALAVLGAFAGATQAQSTITIYGSFDGGVRHTNSAEGSLWTMSSIDNHNNIGNYSNNRIGFKGAEDLGGGLNAHFTLETGWNTGTGALDNPSNLLFQRTAIVGLGGAWGSVDLGRQYSVNFKTIGSYDPFNYKYTMIVPLASEGSHIAVNAAGLAEVAGLTRLSNDIQYTGTFGATTVRAEWALGEQAGSNTNGATKAVGATYAQGPITVGGAYTYRSNNLSAVTTATNYQNQKNWTIGGAFTTGPARIAVGYANAKQDTGIAAASEEHAKNWWVGGTYALSPATALTTGYYETKATFSTAEAKRKLFIVGATYSLSKRTNFYADIDNARFSVANTTPLPNVTGVSVGINHLF